MFLEKCLYKYHVMLYWNKIDVPEGIEFNKIIHLRNVLIVLIDFFVSKRFRFRLSVTVAMIY